MSDKKKRSFSDINEKYSFLNDGVDGLENRHIGKNDNSKKEEPEKRKQKVNNKSQQNNRGQQNKRPSSRPNKRKDPDFRNETIRMDPAAIEKERRRLYLKAKKEKEMKKKRVRLISIGITIIALILFVFVMKALLDKNNEGEVTKPKASTVKATDSAETDTLKGYVLTSKTTKLYEKNSKSSTELSDVPTSIYLESYGTAGDFTKVNYNGVEGYVNTSDTNKVKDKNTFKVIKGVLVVNDEYSLVNDFEPGINSEAKSNFDIMVRKAKADNIIIKVVSDYRSYEQQENNAYKDGISSYGEYKKDGSEVLPGNSEHQTGLAFDVVGNDLDNKYSSYFAESEEYQWLVENAHKHGFIIRYPEGKEEATGRKAEPWHLRYVGTKIAKEMYEKNLCLEEYLGLSSIVETEKKENPTEENKEKQNTGNEQNNLNNQNEQNNENVDGPNANDPNSENVNPNNNQNTNNQNVNNNGDDSGLMEDSAGSNLNENYNIDQPNN